MTGLNSVVWNPTSHGIPTPFTVTVNLQEGLEARAKRDGLGAGVRSSEQ